MSLARIQPLFISPGPYLQVPCIDLQYWRALVDVSHEIRECSELTIQFKPLLGFFSRRPDRPSQASWLIFHCISSACRMPYAFWGANLHGAELGQPFLPTLLPSLFPTFFPLLFACAALSILLVRYLAHLLTTPCPTCSARQLLFVASDAHLEELPSLGSGEALDAFCAAPVALQCPRFGRYDYSRSFWDAGPYCSWRLALYFGGLVVWRCWCLARLAQLAHLPLPILVCGCFLLPRTLPSP